ncbi:MAG: hypothetical protein GXY83_35065 [Rhodopirellula sp.]|nr:hypothetical protein [Rhodopirellula sp.]
MPRTARHTPGGFVYHALNRGVARLPLFEKEGDCAAFERVLEVAQQKHPTRVLAYCLMPNHWHFVLWPREDGEVTAFLRWLTNTHTMRWHAHHHTQGTGHLYQNRFKAFPVQEDDHFYSVVRYVERNAFRANLVADPVQWRWSSLWRRTCGDPVAKGLLAEWPLPIPADWCQIVNRPETEAELQVIRHAIRRGCPCGSESWQKNTAIRLGLQSTLRPRGRPRKP